MFFWVFRGFYGEITRLGTAFAGYVLTLGANNKTGKCYYIISGIP